MRPIAIFYHAKISGHGIDTGHALNILAEQMEALRGSGLLDAATEMHIGVNGDETDACVAGAKAACNARVVCHGVEARSEIPTQKLIQDWLPGKNGWRVLYFHAKGVTAPGQELRERWRKCMARAVIWNWQECMSEMDRGVESCGAHWLTPERFGEAVKTPFWGGTFWWATAEFLRTLPKLPDATWANRYEAESWIGRGPRRPVIKDFHSDWPGSGCHG